MQKSTWIRLYRSDPYFEHLVKKSGVVNSCHCLDSKFGAKKQVYKAVSVFWFDTKDEIIRHVEQKRGISHHLPYTLGLKNALYFWFFENWNRWMAGDWHD